MNTKNQFERRNHSRLIPSLAAITESVSVFLFKLYGYKYCSFFTNKIYSIKKIYLLNLVNFLNSGK